MLFRSAAFGSLGAAGERIGGLRQRRAEAQASDIGRMLIDVELNAGDVGKLVQTYSPQQLGDLAAMQGLFRDKVDFVPLNKIDYDKNLEANGGAGSAGMFIQAPPGEKARVFINLDSGREQALKALTQENAAKLPQDRLAITDEQVTAKMREMREAGVLRDGIAPHEFGHALLKSGALGGAQAEEIGRAHV